MPEGTTTNKVVQLKDPTTKEPVSPVVNVGSIYDKNGKKVDNLVSYKVAGTGVTIPELADVVTDLQDQVDQKLDEVDTALAGIDTAVDDKFAAGGLPLNDIRYYPVRDGESISAGDVVNVDDGVYHNITPQANVENVITSSEINATASCLLSNDYSVIVYSQASVMNVVANLIDNTTMESVKSVQIPNRGTPQSKFAIDRLNDSKTILQCADGGGGILSYILSVDGTSITTTSFFTVASSNSDYNSIVSLSETSALSIYNSSGLKCKVLPISGTTITTSGTVYSLSGNTGANYISACRLPDDSSGNKRICICFSDTGDGNKGKAVIATIDSSNAVTFGDVVTIKDTASTYGNSVVCDTQRIFFSVSGKGYTSNFDLSNVVNLSLNTETLLNISENIFVNIRPLPSTSGMPCYARIVRFNENEFVLGDSFTYCNQAAYMSASLVNDSKILLSYANLDNSSYGTTTVLEVLGNQIAGSFLDNSSDAIALASGNGGDTIPVGFGGYCQCQGVTEGQQIASDGVSAFSPLDGWLYILGDGMKKIGVLVETGSYVGTGTYGNSSKTTLNFNFTPKIIFFRESTKSGSTDCVMIYGAESAINAGNGVEIDWGMNTVSWYNKSSAAYQMNQSGKTYLYVAIG